MLVVFARRNYVQVAQSILADFVHEHGENWRSPKEIRALLLKWNIPGRKGCGWFPFISSPQGILLRLKSDRTLQKIFPIEVLVETIVRHTSSRSS
jgi:hypothetical protein